MLENNRELCTGCGACYNICPKNAITMKGDNYGFLKPYIDVSVCINCGLCAKICPLNNYQSKNFDNPNVYAFLNSDEIRSKSSSGGAFSAFADYVLNLNGIVYGVIWDENIQAIHSRASKPDEIEKMHSSKYVQSGTLDTFIQTKKDLEEDKIVLFSGTPCQIAGLKSYLQKDYQNLITIDLVCHGSQSPLFLEKYKQEFLKDKIDEKILNINFRSKKSPWGTGYFTTTTTTKGIYHNGKDYYTTCMDLTLNEACFNCQFTGIPRIADITIGDFWGVDEYDKKLNDGKGTSIILLNSQKAEDIFEQIKKNYTCAKIPLSAVTKRNPNILRPTPSHPKRNEFLEKLTQNNISFEKLVKKYTTPPLHIAIYRILPQFAKDIIKHKIMKK